MATTYSTPGVYIEEKSSFGSSVVAVATAVPAFIGYTEMANRGSKSLLNEPTKISSMGQFEELFGGPPPTKFNISMDEENEPQGFKLEINKSTGFLTIENSSKFLQASLKTKCPVKIFISLLKLFLLK